MSGPCAPRCTATTASEPPWFFVMAVQMKRASAGVLNIRQFDPSTIKDGSVVGVIGKRGTGKSVLVKDVMYYKRKIPMGLIMSGTEDGNSYYGKFVPDSFVFSEFDKAALERLMERQKKLSKAGRAGRVFVVLDDLMYDKKIMKEKVMRQLLMNGRHWNIFLIVTAQYVADLGPPEIRSNCDYVIACRETIHQNKERLYRMFFGIFPSFDDFCRVFAACTENYGVLVLDNTKQTNNIEDVVFWYKATIRDGPRNFRMGHPEFWKFHKKHYKPEEDDPNAGEYGLGVRRIK